MTAGRPARYTAPISPASRRGVNGIDAARRIVHTSPHVGVIMVTMFDDDDSLFAAMRADARGRAVARGEALFGPAIAGRVLGYFSQRQTAVPRPLFPELTDREREVLGLIAQGLNNAAIARRLSLSPKTVRNHASNIFSKLQVADRAAAIIRARDAGLG